MGTALRATRTTLNGLGVDGELLESAWQNTIVGLARTLGYTAYHTHDSRRSESGFPDLVLAKPGSPVIYAELKRHDGKVSAKQQLWLDLLAGASGSAVYLWRAERLSVRPQAVWEEIADILRLGPGNIGRPETTRWIVVETGTTTAKSPGEVTAMRPAT